MKVAGFYDESISNGLGWRAVLFVSGCPHHCKGCHNKEAQDFSYGEPFDEEALLERIKKNSILKGITISGGEPLCKQNEQEVLEFIRKVKKIRPNFNVWCYTGYTLEELNARNDEITKECLEEIDILVDGKYIEEKKDPNLKFRGSTNQRILDISACMEKQTAISLGI